MYSYNCAKKIKMQFNYRCFNYLVIFMVFGFLVTSCSNKRVVVNKRPAKVSTTKNVAIRGRLINTASKYKGTKYKYGGADPKGFDCSGFTSYVCGKHSIILSRSSSAQAKQGVEIPLAKAKPGDLIFFGRHGRKGKIQHVGMVYSNSSKGIHMIHSSSSKGIIVTNVSTSKYWKPKMLFARRVIHLKS